MSKLRKVNYKYWTKKDGQNVLTETLNNGLFHQWAAGYEEFETGPGNYTYAIVEQPDGTVIEVHPIHIQFVND